MEIIKDLRPTQATIVPDPPGVLTSNAGWDTKVNFDFLQCGPYRNVLSSRLPEHNEVSCCFKKSVRMFKWENVCLRHSNRALAS